MRLVDVVDEYIRAKRTALNDALKRSEALIAKLGADYEVDEALIEDAYDYWGGAPAKDAIEVFNVGIDVIIDAIEDEEE